VLAVVAQVVRICLVLSLPKLQGTPTHMSPELFMEGHVSKASDVYAYGILLFEIITGRRAYSGVPIPLLPHEVAMQGLRPEWPSNLPEDSLQLRDLAEFCWKHQPQDRSVMCMIVYEQLCCAQVGSWLPAAAPTALCMWHAFRCAALES
jgi:serine/threonine protein kinase